VAARHAAVEGAVADGDEGGGQRELDEGDAPVEGRGGDGGEGAREGELDK